MVKKTRCPADLADALDVVTACREDAEQGDELTFQLVLMRAKGEGPPGLVRMIGGFTRLVEILLERQRAATGHSAGRILDDIRKHPR
jgi:hypothetical protein